MAFNTITPVSLGQDELAIAPSFTTLHTTPALSIDYVKDITVANNGTVAADVSLHLVPLGGSADNTNILFPTVKLAKNSFFDWVGTHIIEAGATIQAQSTTADVCVTASGANAV